MGRRKHLVVIPEGEIPLRTRLRIRRQYIGMSVTDLAESAGNYEKSFVSHFEIGRCGASEQSLADFARALGFSSVEEFLAVPREEVLAWHANTEARKQARPIRPVEVPALVDEVTVYDAAINRINLAITGLETERNRLMQARAQLQQTQDASSSQSN